MTNPVQKGAYLDAARRIFQTLSEGGLRLGLSHSMLEQALREAVLTAAYEASEKAGTKITTSSLHVATGIHRREVSRWLKEREEGLPEDRTLNDSPMARVIARWSTNRSYLNADGAPVLLTMAKRNDAPSFSSLVEEIGPEVRARSVLEGLIAAGLVEDLQDGHYRLKAAAYLPEANSPEAIGFLASNVGDHLSAAVHNIAADTEVRFFERAMFMDQIAAGSAATMHHKLGEEGMEFLKKQVSDVNLMNEQDNELGVEKTRRIRIGLYYYEDDALPEGEE